MKRLFSDVALCGEEIMLLSVEKEITKLG